MNDVTSRAQQAAEEHLSPVVELLADAYAHTAIMEWLIADPRNRREVSRRYFRIAAEHAIRRDAATVILDDAGVAAVSIGYRPGQMGTRGEALRHDKHILAAVYPWSGQIGRLHRELSALRPYEDHHHQAFLAVRPDRRGQRLARTLLMSESRALDSTGTPSYAAVVERSALPLYIQQGYVLQGEVPLPDSGPGINLLWRDPRPSSAQSTVEDVDA